MYIEGVNFLCSEHHLFSFTRFTIVHKVVQIPQSVLWHLLAFLLSPVHGRLKLCPLNETSFSKLEYLDVECPKFDISSVKNIWTLINKDGNVKRIGTVMNAQRQTRMHCRKSTIKKT